MANSLTIPARTSYPPAMDYSLLRREGLRHLERLGSSIWTDFNSHDPGVTTLEVLCYALTDLGYRTQLPSADLFSPSGKDRKPFFTAAEILPNAPVTALDFRKLLIDIDGVKNAWLEADKVKTPFFQYDLNNASPVDLAAVPGFADYLQNFTDAAPVSIEIGWSANAKALWSAVELAVKNKAAHKEIRELVKLFNDGCCVEMATNRLPDATSVYAKSVILFLTAHHFAEIRSSVLSRMNAESPSEQQRAFILLDDLNRLKKAIAAYLNDGKRDQVDNAWTPLASQTDWLNVVIADWGKSVLLRERLIVAPVNDTDVKYPVFHPKGIYKIFLQPDEGREADRDHIRQEAYRRLHANRALCEDFGNIRIIEPVGIGIQTTIDITTDADVTDVFAAVLLAIETFLSPAVRMYGLQEMMDRYAQFTFSADDLISLSDAGMPDEFILALEPLITRAFDGKSEWEKAVSNAIGAVAAADYESLLLKYVGKRYESHRVFQGPLLTHGFIDDAELEAAVWRRTVYRSDLFREITRVSNVLKVKDLKVRKCPADDENPRTVEGEWCLSFDCECQPTLELDFLTGSGDSCSAFNFTKNGSPVTLTDSMKWEVYDKLIRLRGQYAKIDRTGRLDLPVPSGVQRDDLADFTSIQEEFPRTYHVGREGISRSETPLRRSQAKQLKGYLMFFDQLLANYLQHLNQIREVLSLDGDLSQPALYQPLYDVPNVQPLLQAISPSGDWEAFKNKPDNDYILSLKALTEGGSVTQKLRKNQILDHLLARFGEQFNDYVLELFRIERPLDDLADDTADAGDWLEDKQRFLQNVPTLGHHRGCGFNYRAKVEDDNRHFWNSDHVEGFKKRVMAQLGVADWSRRTISGAPQFSMEVRTEMFERTRRYRFGVRPEEGGAVLLFSKATYSSASAAQKAGNAFLNKSAYAEQYDLFDNDRGLWFVGFWQENSGTERSMDNAWLISEPFREHGEARKRLAEIVRLVNRERQSDSFHVVEHILLRPEDEFYHLLKPTANPTSVGRNDAYSFCLTVVVPIWGDRYNEQVRYNRFQQIVRTELPAHTHPHFVAMDKNQMLDFESTYYQWLAEKTKPDQDAFELRKAANDLIDLLNQY
ncbi:hypothetical protein LZD49_27930 [Dyadobacter sp. CY261]|uniref:hypothetical protein n=1 Tax=Dyadobacter sp. CY261 TaxID=2907203 RepID=UPI001F307C6A|nr:hypothetical protein [Dyadobacter sp. CY261]MCF0074345.1 hypothetical protein [Dyadobacter sp. CY261]